MTKDGKKEGKNVQMVFLDDSHIPLADVDGRTEKSLEREKIYDEEISPLIKQVISNS